AVAIGAGILLSRLSGLIRQRVFAYYLGSSEAAGAFMAALRVPNMLQNLFGTGVLSASLVPVYARLLAEGREEEAGRAAGAVLSLLSLLVAALTLLGVAFSRPLVTLVAPGFSGEVRELTIRLVAIMFPGMGLLVLSAWCLGVLNSHRKFFLSYVAPVLWNLAIIVALLGFGARLASTRPGQEKLAVVLAWATVVGAALQLGSQVPGAWRLNGGLRLSLEHTLAPVRAILRGFFPALLARGVVQLSGYIDQVLASFLGPQAIAAMAYAQMLYTLPVSLFGMSISSAELTEMSRAVGSPQEREGMIRERLVTGLRRVSFLIVPSSVAFVLLGGVIAAALFETGHFGRSDAYFVWIILIGFTVGLLATTQSRLCVSALWAFEDTRTPAAIAGVRVALTAFFGYLAVFPLRARLGLSVMTAAACLTASAGLAGWLEFVLIRRALARRLGAFHAGLPALARHWASALLAAAAALALEKALPAAGPIAKGVLIVPAYGALYLGLALMLGVPEARGALNRLRAQLDAFRTPRH
ncbi:MAG: murein biosynthesis integral membrane protein MurJ, partial [Elusimicrobia bacterium]|nr:murein biosynthesis integral membrane protein MurJ [Elusimicrobiota bacterium]